VWFKVHDWTFFFLRSHVRILCLDCSSCSGNFYDWLFIGFRIDWVVCCDLYNSFGTHPINDENFEITLYQHVRAL